MGAYLGGNHGMVYPKNIDSGQSNFQLDTRSSGCHRNLDYLHIHRTLSFVSAAARQADQAAPGAPR
jgi:hypothetical protein